MSRPLAVAIAAMALLVASVGFEVVFHRDYELQVQIGGGWSQIGASSGGTFAKPIDTRAGGLVQANRTDDIQFRLEVDNGYPWSFSEAYDVRVNGVIVAEGVIEAPARGAGQSTFAVPASAFFGNMPKEIDTVYAYLDVQIGESFVNGNFQLQEVP